MCIMGHMLCNALHLKLSILCILYKSFYIEGGFEIINSIEGNRVPCKWRDSRCDGSLSFSHL